MTTSLSPDIIRPQSAPLGVGGSGTITGFTQADIASSLMAMGVLPGSNIRLVRLAPFGGTAYVTIDQQKLALRKHELEAIVIRK